MPVGSVQSVLTPVWVGFLGWLGTGLAVLLAVLVFISLGWLWAGAFVVYVAIQTVVLDLVTPWPSHRQCFRIIKSHLRSSLRTVTGDNLVTIVSLLGQVESVERQYLAGG